MQTSLERQRILVQIINLIQFVINPRVSSQKVYSPSEYFAVYLRVHTNSPRDFQGVGSPQKENDFFLFHFFFLVKIRSREQAIWRDPSVHFHRSRSFCCSAHVCCGHKGGLRCRFFHLKTSTTAYPSLLAHPVRIWFFLHYFLFAFNLCVGGILVKCVSFFLDPFCVNTLKRV